MANQLVPLEPQVLTGEEQLLPSVSVRDFWAWALGDLRLNANRGMLAQFLVAKAVGDSRLRDDGWGNYDVLSMENIRIEVKSSGYLQSWNQSKVSTIGFSGLFGRAWDDRTGAMTAQPVERADVFVFAVHTCIDHSLYDPLDLSSWDFHIVSSSTIYALSQKTLRLTRLLTLPGVISTQWAGIHKAVNSSLRTS